MIYLYAVALGACFAAGMFLFAFIGMVVCDTIERIRK